MTDPWAAATPSTRGWLGYAALLVVFWGVWGAFSALPATRYGYPDEMIYAVWAVTMIVPAAFALRRQPFDRRPVATWYGLSIGLTGAGGQLALFAALTMGPAYLIFPIVSISPAITVVLAIVLLRERISRLPAVGLGAVLAAVMLFGITGADTRGSGGPWLLLAVVVCAAWGVQAFLLRKVATLGINEATTFAWMAIGGLLLVPVALLERGDVPSTVGWPAMLLTAGTQLLNAIGALFLVMSLHRGKATVVAPVTNALAPALTVVVSLIAYRALPSACHAVGIVLGLLGSTLMVYCDERRCTSITGTALTERVR